MNCYRPASPRRKFMAEKAVELVCHVCTAGSWWYVQQAAQSASVGNDIFRYDEIAIIVIIVRNIAIYRDFLR